MILSDFLISTDMLLIFAIFGFLRGENQRWTRAISAGRKGSSELVNLFANATAFFATAFSIGCLAFILIFSGWQPALGTAFVLFLTSVFTAMIVGATIGDNFPLQLLATVSIWPVGFILGAGLLNNY